MKNLNSGPQDYSAKYLPQTSIKSNRNRISELRLARRVQFNFKLKSLVFLLMITVTSFWGIQKVYPQNVIPPCRANASGYFYKFPLLQQFPNLNTGMPYEVLKGYVMFDSLLRFGTFTDIVTGWSAGNDYNSTMKQFMKYYYSISDYNPIDFVRHQEYKFENSNGLTTWDIFKYLDLAITKISAEPELDRLLLNSKYIAQIRVSNSSACVDSSNKNFRMDIIKIDARIVESIKGKILPNCLQDIQRKKEFKQKDKLMTAFGDCISFDYATRWGLNPQFFNSSGDYIVFLDFLYDCADSANTYNRLSPRPIDEGRVPVFKIVNGIVENPDNMFNFGQNLNLQEFLNRLRNRISYIQNL